MDCKCVSIKLLEEHGVKSYILRFEGDSYYDYLQFQTYSNPHVAINVGKAYEVKITEQGRNNVMAEALRQIANPPVNADGWQGLALWMSQLAENALTVELENK